MLPTCIGGAKPAKVVGMTQNEPVKTSSRVTGAVAGFAAGWLLPIPVVGPLTGAVAGAIFGPKIKAVNTVGDKAVEKLGEWAGRR